MSIIIKDGVEIWTKERFIVTTWTLDFYKRKVKDERKFEVEAYSDFTAIDVAVDEGICYISEVTERNRIWEVSNVADAQAAVEFGDGAIPRVYDRDPVFYDEVCS